jgi:hypothetical protein
MISYSRRFSADVTNITLVCDSRHGSYTVFVVDVGREEQGSRIHHGKASLVRAAPRAAYNTR